jgi:multimeric flavodoxin WrbA
VHTVSTNASLSASTGRVKGEVEQDEEALRTMEALGQNMAWLLKRINT